MPTGRVRADEDRQCLPVFPNRLHELAVLWIIYWGQSVGDEGRLQLLGIKFDDDCAILDLLA